MISTDMEHSKVYGRIHFLLYLKDESVSGRKIALTNITSGQVEAISVVAERVVNSVVSPMRRDVPLFRRKRTILRTLSSKDVSFTRKKALLRHNHSLIPVLLRTPYLIQVILDEVGTTREE